MTKTLPQLIDQFLEHMEVEKGCSKLTIRDYRHYLEIFAQWLSSTLPEVPIENITLDNVRTYRVYLANRVDDKGLTLKRATQNYYIIALRSFLRYLIKNDIPTLEPSKIDLPKAESRSLKFLERDHMIRLVAAVDISEEEGLRDRAILELLFSTGLRVSELVKLNHKHINLERKEFGVIGKGGKARVVFISEDAAQWVERYLNERKDDFAPLFIRYSGRIDSEKNGEKMRLTPRSIERIVKKYVRKARLPIDATVHTLRHSFATDLLTNGADIRAVQEMLGHKNIATTQIYTHVTNRQLREIHKNFHSGNSKS